MSQTGKKKEKRVKGTEQSIQGLWEITKVITYIQWEYHGKAEGNIRNI